MNLTDSIGILRNVGERRGNKLNFLGIYTIYDLITHYPRNYEDRSKITKIKDLCANENNVFQAAVLKDAENVKINGKIITKAVVKDDTGVIECCWYNQSYLKNTLIKGCTYIFIGKVQNKYGKMQVSSPKFEKTTQTLCGNVETALRTGNSKQTPFPPAIIPIYPSTNKLSQKILRGLIKDALEAYEIEDVLPCWIKEKYQLAEKRFAVQNIHFPQNKESFIAARKRLVFEELFILQLSLFKIRELSRKSKGVLFPDTNLQPLLSILPFEMTKDQQKVVEEIKNDFTTGYAMNRLVQGDVGSGKTLVALAASAICIRNGYQAVLMAPTDVLARQHFETFTQYFQPLGIQVALLSGSLKKKERENVLSAIRSFQAEMVIGTHAVIQKAVIFNKLGFVVTDEQHRFGVKQRQFLSEKGENPHVLVMTATPIPRTLALILYGDLDISLIEELPPGRQKIETYVVNASYHQRIYNFIKKEVDKGYQAYIICPITEESETLDVKAVTNFTAELQKEDFKDYQVEYIHGKMKPSEKERIMTLFYENKIHILVATTVIEVGIHNPRANVMVIENAERFGLSQLHQLRGRVGRSGIKSYCILITDTKTKISMERMDVIKNSANGFEISEQDLKIRGPGDFFGTRQHGLPELKIANLYKDLPLLKMAQEAAGQVIAEGNSFYENSPLHEEVNKILMKTIIF